jgi:hypothetical protein
MYVHVHAHARPQVTMTKSLGLATTNVTGLTVFKLGDKLPTVIDPLAMLNILAGARGCVPVSVCVCLGVARAPSCATCRSVLALRLSSTTQHPHVLCHKRARAQAWPRGRRT